MTESSKNTPKQYVKMEPGGKTCMKNHFGVTRHYSTDSVLYEKTYNSLFL